MSHDRTKLRERLDWLSTGLGIVSEYSMGATGPITIDGKPYRLGEAQAFVSGAIYAMSAHGHPRVADHRAAVTDCPRCGRNHVEVHFQDLDSSVPLVDGEGAAWGRCPSTGDPIIALNGTLGGTVTDGQ